MVIGYDTYFNFISSDTRAELIKSDYNSKNQKFAIMSLQLNYDLMINRIPFFGIPILSNLDSSNKSLAIGYNFHNTQSDNEFEMNAFSYCLKTSCFVNLPKFTFCTLIILKNPSSSYESIPLPPPNLLKPKPYI